MDTALQSGIGETARGDSGGLISFMNYLWYHAVKSNKCIKILLFHGLSDPNAERKAREQKYDSEVDQKEKDGKISSFELVKCKQARKSFTPHNFAQPCPDHLDHHTRTQQIALGPFPIDESLQLRCRGVPQK